MENGEYLHMSIKVIGAVLTMLSCGTLGFLLSARVRAEVNHLQDLIGILDFMECELNYRLPSLPKLCRSAAEQGSSLIAVFSLLADNLENQISPDPAICMDTALLCYRGPASVAGYLHELGRSFGKFDLQGQLTELNSVRQRCAGELAKLKTTQDIKAKYYRTISICAGVVVTILLL